MNPEIEKQISLCVKSLREDGYIIFPSEIGWSIGCDATQPENVTAILLAEKYHTPAILLEEPGHLIKYVKDFPDAGYDLAAYSAKPLHFIIEDPAFIPSAAFKTVLNLTFRIVKDEFTFSLLHKFGKPLFAAYLGSPTQPLKTTTVLNKSCFVVNLRASSKANPDQLSVIKFYTGGRMEIIRK